VSLHGRLIYPPCYIICALILTDTYVRFYSGTSEST